MGAVAGLAVVSMVGRAAESAGGAVGSTVTNPAPSVWGAVAPTNRVASPEPVEVAAVGTNAVREAVGATNEPVAVSPVVEGPTLAQAVALIEGAKADAQIDEDARKRVIERYESARVVLAAAEEGRRKAEAIEQLIATGPARTLELGSQLDQLSGSFSNQLAALRAEVADLGVDALTQRMAVEQAAEARLKVDLDTVTKRGAALEGRPAKGREERAAIDQRLKALDEEAKAPVAAGVSPREAEALQFLRRAGRMALEAEALSLDKELIAVPIETKLRLAERNLLSRQIERHQARLRVLEDLAQRAREAEVRQVRRETAQAEQRLRNEHPAIRALVATNLLYVAELEASERLLARARGAAEALKAQRTRLDEEVVRTERQMAIAGLTEPMGELLLDERRRLTEAAREAPLARIGAGDLRLSARMISTNGLRRFHVEEALRSLAVVEERVEEWFGARVEGSVDDDEGVWIRGQLRDLFTKQREYLTRLAASYTSLMEALSDALTAQSELMERQRRHLQFLEHKLIWIPSSPPVNWGTLRDVPASLRRVLGPEARAEVWTVLKQSQRHHVWGPFLLASLVVWVLRRRFIEQLNRMADLVRRPITDRPSYTLRSLGLTVGLGAPVGFLVYVVGKDLLQAGPTGPARSAAEGLIYCGVFLALAGTGYELGRPRGLAEAHFRWPAAGLKLLRWHLRWWIPLHAGLTLVAVTAINDPGRQSYDSLARVVFLAAMGALGVLLWRVAHPRTGVFADGLSARPEGWPARLSRFWYPAIVALPVLAAGLSLAGYSYTVLRLTHELMKTLGMVGAAIIAYEVVKRWFVVQERRIAIEQALERRRQARAAREAAGSGAEPDPETSIQVEEPELDLATVKEQTRRLLKALLWIGLLIGVYLLWAPLLPALSFLDEKAVWSVTTTVDGKPAVVAITPSAILGAGVIVLLTIAAFRNLPGVLEIAVLEKLPLDPGSRYAITAIVSYVLVVVGVFLAAGQLGVQWGQLGWIVAALSVGLGFGLQEIVANFVCGLLIFLERPVRVGDVVTVNEMTGVVSQIQIRATTIVDWDRKEYIVPNKDFITGRILNWTLSNTINRVVVVVGVAYGSDVERAASLMRSVAEAHPDVLKDPAPSCFFEAFDASSLRMVLRFFLPRLDRRLPATHEVLAEIQRRFREAGIEIAFPQQDVHIRTVPRGGLLETVVGSGPAGGSPEAPAR